MTEFSSENQMPQGAPPPSVPAGWYPDPNGGGQRWWDGTTWTTYATPPGQSIPSGSPIQQMLVVPSTEKSSGIAVLLTVLWPGAGHMYLGLTKRGTPFVVANAIGFVISLTGILFFVGLIIWIVTLCMTVGGISTETELVNQASRQGRRLVEQ